MSLAIGSKWVSLDSFVSLTPRPLVRLWSRTKGPEVSLTFTLFWSHKIVKLESRLGLTFGKNLKSYTASEVVHSVASFWSHKTPRATPTGGCSCQYPPETFEWSLRFQNKIKYTIIFAALPALRSHATFVDTQARVIAFHSQQRIHSLPITWDHQ